MIVRREEGAARIPLADALARGPAWWDAAVAASGTTSPFMGWAWHEAWAATAPPDELAGAFLVVADADDPASGFLPLALRAVSFRRARAAALTWAIGSVGCPDHLDFPLAPGTSIERALPLLESLPWDLAVLGGVADAAPNVDQLVTALERRGFAVRQAPLDICPVIALPDSWEAYLAAFSPSRRQAIRRRERRLERTHAVAISDHDTPDRLDEGWRRLRALHAARWGGPGALGDPRLERLLVRFCATLAAEGRLWLTTLDCSGVPAAAWLGLTSGDTVYFYQSGRDPAHDAAGVGSVLMGMMIRRAIECGYRRVDLLRGDDAYKREWGAVPTPIHEVVAFRPGWRGTWLRALDEAGRVRARLRARPEFAGAG